MIKIPTGYTAPVESGEITELKDFAAECARAFGAFIHQRDSSSKALTYPENPRYKSWHNEQLNVADHKRKTWDNLTEEEKYARWSKYYRDALVAFHKAKAESAVKRARYEGMLAQVQSIDVPSELQNFKDFMVEQLESSIQFDCHDYDDPKYNSWLKPKEYVEWCEFEAKSPVEDITYHTKQLAKETERYEERVHFINLMRETFGFEVQANG